MPQDRFVAETIAGERDLAQGLDTSVPHLREVIGEMSPMALIVLLAKGSGGAGTGTAVSPVARERLEELVRRLAERNGFEAKHVREAMVLLENGTLERDLASVVAQTSRVIGQIPSAAAKSVQRTLANPLRVLGFTFAMAHDLAELPAEGVSLSRREFERLMRGGAAGPGRDFPLFDHTFEALYEIEPIDVLKDWLLEVTERPSVQLALIVYARTQGVELTPADIEAARMTLRQGNLTPVIVQGIEYFRREHAGRFPEILGMLG